MLVAADDGATQPSERTVFAIGEAKAGERVGRRQLHRLERARASLGTRAAGAKLLLFGCSFEAELVEIADMRNDVEVVDLGRLYGGA